MAKNLMKNNSNNKVNSNDNTIDSKFEDSKAIDPRKIDSANIMALAMFANKSTKAYTETELKQMTSIYGVNMLSQAKYLTELKLLDQSTIKVPSQHSHFVYDLDKYSLNETGSMLYAQIENWAEEIFKLYSKVTPK